MSKLRTHLLGTGLAVCAFSAQAADTSWRYYYSPDNVMPLSMANTGDGVVAITSASTAPVFGQVGNYFMAANGSAAMLGGITNQNIKISADARYVGASIDAGGGLIQAAVLDRNTGVWSAQGGLNGSASVFRGMSGNGQWVVGSSVFNGNVSHAVVLHNGQAIDLTPSSAVTGANGPYAVAVSNDGRVVTGYAAGNNTNGSYWLWNDASQSYSVNTPTILNVGGTAQTNIQADVVSGNGLWIAGGSSTTNRKSINFGNNIFAATITNVSTGVTSNIPWTHDPFADGNALDDILLNMRPTVTGVSNNGMVIGQFNIAAGLGQVAGLLSQETFIYFANSAQVMTFDSYLAALGTPLTSTQHVNLLSAISEDGTQIAGTIFDTSLGTNGQTVGFALSGATLVAAVPEPGQWALLALGLPLLLARRLRRDK